MCARFSGAMRSRDLTGGSRSRLQEREPAHAVVQVALPYPGGGDASSFDALHPRPLHLVDHAVEHMFDAHADPAVCAAEKIWYIF